MNEYMANHLSREFRIIGKKPIIGTLDKVNYYLRVMGKQFASAQEAEKTLTLATREVLNRPVKYKRGY